MRYISTRGDTTERDFSEILLEGLAPDGGLYLPIHYPKIDDATLTRWRGMGYADLAFEILSLFITDMPPAELKVLVDRTYTKATYGSDAIVPVRRLAGGVSPLYIEALSNGPTLAFKDMAMQLLGNLFEYELARRGERLNILGATSGDTGSAAEYAMRGKKGVRVFMLSPQGRMSPFQQAQMFSLQDPNIHNIAVEGVFDDCQDIVKAVSNDLEFKRRHKIGTVNSINWARLLAQVVYYFAGYFQVTSSNAERVSFAVPSGNFGNVCAGHVARSMGLPVAELVVATIFPAHRPGHAFYEDIKQTNAALRAMQLEREPKVHLLDLWPEMIEADGTLKRALFQSDNVHLTQDGGYEFFAARLQSLITRLP
jgi:threonine synthase